jgi:hypothetical protein
MWNILCLYFRFELEYIYVPLATNQSIKSNQSVDHITLGKQKIREANQFNINTVHNDQTVGVQKKTVNNNDGER